jgi:hypothetical protein
LRLIFSNLLYERKTKNKVFIKLKKSTATTTFYTKN